MCVVSDVTIVRGTINVGVGARFSVDTNGDYENITQTTIGEIRKVIYDREQFVDKFPLLIGIKRFKDVAEMNLYMIHRYLGQFATRQNNKIENAGLSQAYQASAKAKGANIKTIHKTAQHLKRFLVWLDSQLEFISWDDTLAEPVSETTTNLSSTPIWMYREYLIKLVLQGELRRDTANNMINDIRYFYEWAWLNQRISVLPFKNIVKRYRPKKKRTDNLNMMLAGMGGGLTKSGSIPVFTSNLSLPKKLIQKQASPEESLQPYSEYEILSLLTSDTVTKSNSYALWIKLGFFSGLRRLEVTLLNRTNIVNPSLIKQEVFKITLEHTKFDKSRPIKISKQLMSDLWSYVNTTEYQKRQIKYESKYGIENSKHPIPLFISPRGERILPESVGNIISKVRTEQSNKGLPVLKRNFHDLRASFGTNLASYLLLNGHKDGFVRVILMRELGHSDFSTTEKYINWCKGETFAMISKEWRDEVYSAIQDKMKGSLLLGEECYE